MNSLLPNVAIQSGASLFPERFFCTISAHGREPRYRLYGSSLVELRKKMVKANVRSAHIYDVVLRGRIV